MQMLVDGAWVDAASGETFTAFSPATGAAIGELPQGSRDDARRAIDAAGRAAGGWASATAFERAVALHRVADGSRERRDGLAHVLTLDQGKPLHAESYDEVDELVSYWRTAAEDGKRLRAGCRAPSRRASGCCSFGARAASSA
jgi:succinate-semialdehyde dehydrogenase/glutarate-semialdehyde dehydrogenase